MAQTPEIVIFPKIRCSDLERDAEEKRRTFLTSEEAFVANARKKARPFVFIRQHPKLLLGVLFTLFSGSKYLVGIGSSLFGRKKKSLFWRIVKAGWFWKVSKMMAGWLISKKGPDLEKLGLAALRSFLNSRKVR